MRCARYARRSAKIGKRASPRERERKRATRANQNSRADRNRQHVYSQYYLPANSTRFDESRDVFVRVQFNVVRELRQRIISYLTRLGGGGCDV